jgi:hypothetical protein
MSTTTTARAPNTDRTRKIIRTPAGRPWVEVEVAYDGTRLSICGTVGAYPNQGSDPYRCVDGKTRRSGSCGQVTEDIAEVFPEIARLLPYHLNDMRAGCVHQRAAWDISASIEIVSYKLTSEARKLRDETLKAAALAALRGEPFNPTPTARALAAMTDWYASRYAPPDADSPLSGCYEVEKRETKAAGWVSPNEHPDGLLSKPCEVCGYKYGTAWLTEPLPKDIRAYVLDILDRGEAALTTA